MGEPGDVVDRSDPACRPGSSCSHRHHRPARLTSPAPVRPPDTLGGMNTCALTRLLWPAFLVGLVVGGLAGNDTWGWVAAALTAGSIFAVQQVRGTSRSCSIAPRGADRRSTPDLTADEHRDPAPR